MELNNKIFIGGLSYSTTEEVLIKELQKYGNVLSLRIILDHDTGMSKGFGFATMETPEQAKLVIDNLGDTVFDGRRIGVKPSLRKERR